MDKKAHTERQKSVCASFEKLNAINRLIKLTERDKISHTNSKESTLTMTKVLSQFIHACPTYRAKTVEVHYTRVHSVNLRWGPIIGP